MKTAFTIVYVFLATSVGASAADWKLYGAADNKQQCFYDVESVSFQSLGHPRVWTKCLSEGEMEAVAPPERAEIVERAARSIVQGYVPPIANVMKFPFKEQLSSVIQYETTANYSSLHSTVTIFWELNCSETMISMLQISTRNGVHGKPSQPKWSHAAPDTNADRLLKMVCRG